MPFLKNFVIFSLIVAVMVILFEYILPSGYIHPSVWAMFFFYMFVTLGLYMFSTYGAKHSSRVFMTATFGGMAVKLALCLGFIFVYLLNNVENRGVFVANFLVLYFFFTVFEVYSLMSNLRAQKNSGKTPNK